MKTKWLGLWAQERAGLYAGQVIKKSDIPKYTRVVLRYNKYYKKGDKRPRFVFCFADSEGYKETCIPIEIEEGRPYKEDGKYYTEQGERLYTEEDARAIICGTMQAYASGYHDPGDVLTTDFVW